MENVPMRSVYRMDYLGGSFGRHLDSLLPSQSGVFAPSPKVGYEAGLRLLQERNYRWFSHLFGPTYGDYRTLSPYSSDPMKSLRYAQRDNRRRLMQPKEVKPLLFDDPRMEVFNSLCELHRDTYNDHGKQHIRYQYFQTRDNMRQMAEM